MYQEKFSAIRSALFDAAMLIVMFIILLSSSFKVLNGDIVGKLTEMIELFLFGVVFVCLIWILIIAVNKIRKAARYKRDWLIELTADSIRLESPDSDEVEPFDFHPKEIIRLSREAYDDDGVWYRWFLYVHDNGKESKKAFELGPFSEAKIAAMLNKLYGIRLTQVELGGEVRDWRYTFGFRLRVLLGSVFGSILLLGFLTTGSLYLIDIVS